MFRISFATIGVYTNPSTIRFSVGDREDRRPGVEPFPTDLLLDVSEAVEWRTGKRALVKGILGQSGCPGAG
jgi:hypothetical protein